LSDFKQILKSTHTRKKGEKAEKRRTKKKVSGYGLITRRLLINAGREREGQRSVSELKITTR